MRSLQPRAGHALLRCPHCRSSLTAAAGALVCRNRHSFDLARQGYVNLLASSRRHPAADGDDREQLRHRASFLEAGFLDFVDHAIADRVGPSARCIVEAGSGTGHHLANVAAGIGGAAVGLGLDISTHAASHASRAWPELAFAVVDVWRQWPVRDAVADLVLSLFAPKNFAEMARVLRPGGWLALAYPGPDHLIELRNRFLLLDQHEQSGARYRDLAARFIGPPSVTRLRRHAVLDPDAVRSAILMGPNAHRMAPSLLAAPLDPMPTTLDIHLMIARKPEGKA